MHSAPQRGDAGLHQRIVVHVGCTARAAGAHGSATPWERPFPSLRWLSRGPDGPKLLQHNNKNKAHASSPLPALSLYRTGRACVACSPIAPQEEAALRRTSASWSTKPQPASHGGQGLRLPPESPLPPSKLTAHVHIMLGIRICHPKGHRGGRLPHVDRELQGGPGLQGLLRQQLAPALARAPAGCCCRCGPKAGPLRPGPASSANPWARTSNQPRFPASHSKQLAAAHHHFACNSKRPPTPHLLGPYALYGLPAGRLRRRVAVHPGPAVRAVCAQVAGGLVHLWISLLRRYCLGPHFGPPLVAHACTPVSSITTPDQ